MERNPFWPFFLGGMVHLLTCYHHQQNHLSFFPHQNPFSYAKDFTRSYNCLLIRINLTSTKDSSNFLVRVVINKRGLYHWTVIACHGLWLPVGSFWQAGGPTFGPSMRKQSFKFPWILNEPETVYAKSKMIWFPSGNCIHLYEQNKPKSWIEFHSHMVLPSTLKHIT